MKYDVFISHASEDKNDVVRPLAKQLSLQGLNVWFDECELTLGDSLRRKIDHGLAQSRFGVVILSSSFFAKEWPQKELDALVSREEDGQKAILPIWHNVTGSEIQRRSPLLSDKIAVSTSLGIDIVAQKISDAVKTGRQNAFLAKVTEAVETVPGDHTGEQKNLGSWTRASGWKIRLLLAEVCCNLCRFNHAKEHGLSPGEIEVNQEFSLSPGVFADIRVQVPGQRHYFMEVKYGYTSDELVNSFARKYRGTNPQVREALKVVLVVDSNCFDDSGILYRKLEKVLNGTVKLEVWDDKYLRSEFARVFGSEVDAISENTAESLRVALDDTKGRFAFGEGWTGDHVQSTLLWHLGFWRIEQLRSRGVDLNSVLQAVRYPKVVVLIADLSSFSSYVRDTQDSEVIRAALNSFYAKSRYEILNSGGLLYQCSGDQVMALYGVPDRPDNYLQDALRCARAISDVGNSVSSGWQRHIDLLQEMRGVHIGMAFGDVEVVRVRPFARIRFGIVGDCVNIAFRLLAAASSGEVVVNNQYSRRLDTASKEGFEEIDALNVNNVGMVRAFKAKL